MEWLLACTQPKSPVKTLGHPPYSNTPWRSKGLLLRWSDARVIAAAAAHCQKRFIAPVGGDAVFGEVGWGSVELGGVGWREWRAWRQKCCGVVASGQRRQGNPACACDARKTKGGRAKASYRRGVWGWGVSAVLARWGGVGWLCAILDGGAGGAIGGGRPCVRAARVGGGHQLPARLLRTWWAMTTVGGICRSRLMSADMYWCSSVFSSAFCARRASQSSKALDRSFSISP